MWDSYFRFLLYDEIIRIMTIIARVLMVCHMNLVMIVM